MAQERPVPGQPAASTANLTIDQAVSEALEHNLDLTAEKLNITVAEARQITARLRPNPVLTLSGQLLDLLGTNFNPSSPAGPNQFNAHTDFVLERAHKRQERMAVASAERTLAELGVREMMRQVIYTTQSAFVDVQQAKESLALADSNQKSLDAIVAINEVKVKSGELAQVELDRSKVAALQYQTAVDGARLALEQAKLRLQLLLGRKDRSLDFDVAGPMRRDIITGTEASLKTNALASRPDLLVSRQSQARSQADLRLQLANGKIDYTVGTEYSRQWAYGIGGNSLGFSFSAPLPVFSRNQGEIARAQREGIQAAARIQALEASVGTDVELAYRQYAISKSLLENIETNLLARAKSVRETTEYSYRRGEASLVEYLDAQRAYNDAVQSHIDARANYARSLYRIESVSGASVDGKEGRSND